MTRLTTTKRSDYQLFRTLATRWGDVDIYGHVNNVVYLSYFDTAINGWYIDAGMLEMGRSDEVFLVVETGAQYFAEIVFPDVVYAGIRVLKLGRSSVTYDIALFTNDNNSACARGRYTHVLVDHHSRQPVAIEGHKRTCLERYLVSEM
ncbi:MAG: thioesterase family protein [Pseudomonadota bacterium]